MEWKDVLAGVGKYSSKIANVAMNPIGGGIDLVLTALGDIFGFDPKTSTPDEAQAIIERDPEARMKFRMLEMQLEQQERDNARKAEIETLKSYLEDIQNARGAKVEGERATGQRDSNLYVLAWTVVAGFFGLMAVLIFVPVPADQNGVIFMLFGALATGFGQVLQFFFGSSKGSQAKDDVIGQMAKDAKK